MPDASTYRFSVAPTMDRKLSCLKSIIYIVPRTLRALGNQEGK